MKTYSFQVVLEKDKWPDEPDENAVWRAYIPALEHQGASSWGYTQKETLKNLQDAVDLLIESFLAHKKELPSGLFAQTQISDLPLIRSPSS
ncbi:type II toxin-antitoxin system HicB family antitoxin [Candidatus Poribacteria bacterium]|nr:type II toxin-antitoxin system HicB family antitoxin [Candidatus Poribacteria bacterium]MYB01251.1 type II toxin-antitoxin system HicB family antitoxin [Candidatus Poribacteria bacterium]